MNRAENKAARAEARSRELDALILKLQAQRRKTSFSGTGRQHISTQLVHLYRMRAAL